REKGRFVIGKLSRLNHLQGRELTGRGGRCCRHVWPRGASAVAGRTRRSERHLNSTSAARTAGAAKSELSARTRFLHCNPCAVDEGDFTGVSQPFPGERNLG